MKQHATTLILLLVAVALGAWLWFGRDKVTEGERKRRENNVFSAWRREELSRIEIAHEGETIVLEREAKADSPWRMTSPRQERVDQAAAERLSTTLEFAAIVRKVSADSVLGLDAPRATGSVTMAPLVFRFALGASSPRPEGASYFRVDDGAPFVASRELTEALLAPSDTYRDRTVVPYLSLELARFEVRHPSGGFAVDRADERSFKIEGRGVLASRAALDKAWGALAEMRAEAFPKDADIDRLTANPRLTIVMVPKEPGKPRGELVVGDTCPGHPNDVVVLRKEPTRAAACAPKGVIDALLAIGPDVLIDKKPFSFRHDEIEELVLEKMGADAGAGPRVIEIARRGTGFHQREPEDRELSAEEADSASELLSLIEHGAAESVSADDGPFEAVARARVRSGEYEETVEVGPLPALVPPNTDGGARDASDEKRPSVVLRRLRDRARLIVTPDVARRLVPRDTTLRPRALLAETRRVKRAILRCGIPQELIDEGSGLSLVDPPGHETDSSIVQLVDGLVRGKVLAWVADADDGTFGFEPRDSKNDCRVIVAFADGNAPATVRFGGEGEGGFYGKVEGKPEVFVASRGLYELAKRIYVSHAALRVEPSRIDSVKVVSRDKSLTVRDPAALRNAAGSLFADRIVSVGSADIGDVDVEVVIGLSEGGPPKRVVCSAAGTTASGVWRRCATPGVKAVFEVRSALVDALFTAPDASVVDASASNASRTLH